MQRTAKRVAAALISAAMRTRLAAPVLGLLAMQALLAQAQARSHAQLEADLLLQGRPGEGLLVLNSGYEQHDVFDADATVWLGAGSDVSGDVLTANVGFRDPGGKGQGRIGRLVLATGAVRPVHMDGVVLLARAPTGTSLEVFAGSPVAPAFAPRSFDWLAGGRIAQQLFAERVQLGLSYLHRRDAGQLTDEEIGADLALRPLSWLQLGAVGAVDRVYPGLSDARISALAHGERVDLELFASRRVAARILPATSLFSILSDTAASDLGLDTTLRAFPRLDVGGAAALERAGDAMGYRIELRSVLRLDDEGRADVSIEGDRRRMGGQGWTAVLLTAQGSLTERLRPHASLELVAIDAPEDTGTLWPWARVGASYALTAVWWLAGAVEVKASPQYRSELNALLRVGYRGSFPGQVPR